ncbi:MAG: methionyl aminopeptidase [Parachlamydiaceae bacterium]
MIGRNDDCWCSSGKKWKKCHYPQLPEKKEMETDVKKTYLKRYGIIVKNQKQIEGIKAACKLAAEILEEVCKAAKEGVTTQSLNDLAVSLHKKAGAIAAPLHYGEPPFPKSICTSVNEVICHGIPDQRTLKEGDIINIDITCILSGYYGDCSKMVVIGPTTEGRQRVVDVAYESLMRSIATLKPGIFLSKIGETIEDYAVPKGCSVVNQFVGHGVGVDFHEGPQIYHHRNKMHIPLVPGMIFTIEPMINEGVREAVIDPIDQWTARTKDGKASAQFEHTVLITDTGAEILTPWTR